MLLIAKLIWIKKQYILITVRLTLWVNHVETVFSVSKTLITQCFLKKKKKQGRKTFTVLIIAPDPWRLLLNQAGASITIFLTRSYLHIYPCTFSWQWGKDPEVHKTPRFQYFRNYPGRSHSAPSKPRGREDKMQKTCSWTCCLPKVFTRAQITTFLELGQSCSGVTIGSSIIPHI